MYSPASGKLQKITPLPQMPIGFGSAMTADQHGHIVFIGGYDPIHNVTPAQTWLVNLQPLPPLPQGGSFLGAAACDGKGHVYLVHGANNPARPTTDFLILTFPS
jgi:hypothetical protein